MLEWTAQQLELLPLDSVATRPEWVKLPGQSCAVWELHQHSKEAKAAALRVYSGELQLVPASMLPWKTKGRALTDSGHAIRDIYILMEV